MLSIHEEAVALDKTKELIKVLIEVCQCGCETFYISKAREVYCSDCEVRIDDVTVFDYSAKV